MSYSTNPVLDAARHYDSLYAWRDRQNAAEDAMAEDFVMACGKPLHLPAMFARSTLYDRCVSRPSVAQELEDTLEYQDFKPRMLQLFCDLAAGRADPEAAMQLLKDMGRRYAELNAENVE